MSDWRIELQSVLETALQADETLLEQLQPLLKQDDGPAPQTASTIVHALAEEPWRLLMLVTVLPEESHPIIKTAWKEAMLDRALRGVDRGVQLFKMDDREGARAATEAAIQDFRMLAGALPGLATALNNLGSMLAALGRNDAALDAVQESVTLRRTLTQIHPDIFRPLLAQSLDNLGTQLHSLNRREEALEVTREAVALLRTLAAERPDTDRPALARALDNLGIRLDVLRHNEEALRITGESVALYRLLVQAQPAVFRPKLANVLNNLGVRLYRHGRLEESLEAIQEAVALYRTCATESPRAVHEGLALSLSQLGERLREAGQPDAAWEANGEALSTLVPYFLTYPAAYADQIRWMVRDYIQHAPGGQPLDDTLLTPLRAKYDELGWDFPGLS